MNRRGIALVVLSAALTFSASPFVLADVVYSNLGLELSTGASTLVTSQSKYAMPFVSGGAYLLQNAELDIADLAPNGNTLTVGLFSGVSFPETVIATASITNIPGSVYRATADFSAQAKLLNAGTKYWLEADTTSPTVLLWFNNPFGILGRSSFDGTQWVFDQNSVMGAFRINGTPVPEPSTLALGAVALASLPIRRRKSVPHDRV